MGFDAEPVILAVVNNRGTTLTDTQRIAAIRRVVEAGQAIRVCAVRLGSRRCHL